MFSEIQPSETGKKLFKESDENIDPKIAFNKARAALKEKFGINLGLGDEATLKLFIEKCVDEAKDIEEPLTAFIPWEEAIVRFCSHIGISDNILYGKDWNNLELAKETARMKGKKNPVGNFLKKQRNDYNKLRDHI